MLCNRGFLYVYHQLLIQSEENQSLLASTCSLTKNCVVNRYEKETLLRQEAEDRGHQLQQQLDFQMQLHAKVGNKTFFSSFSCSSD